MTFPNPLDFYADQLRMFAEEGILRRRRQVAFDDISQPMHVFISNQQVLNFSGNDYLGLSTHPELMQASIDAITQYGTGSASSRLISGTGPLVTTLEETLCRFKHTENALVFGSGYQANVALLQALTGSGDWIFADRLNHASLVDGCRLSGARWTRYRHLDLEHLEALLKKAPSESRRWIVTDTVFSMDGDYPDLPALCDIAEKYGALVMVDEAHATGIYGATRSGLCEAQGVGHRVALQMGTFSKALGGSGAYVAANNILIDWLVNKARGFIYSTALPPAVIASAQAAVDLVSRDASYTGSLWENIRTCERAIIDAGLETSFDLPLKSPIVPMMIGEAPEAVRISQLLMAHGFYVQAIRPPTVPPKTSRLRISLSAAHQPEDIQRLITTLAEVLQA